MNTSIAPFRTYWSYLLLPESDINTRALAARLTLFTAQCLIMIGGLLWAPRPLSVFPFVFCGGIALIHVYGIVKITRGLMTKESS